MKVYAYCLVEAGSETILSPTPGVTGEPLQMVECGSIEVVSSRFPNAEVRVTRRDVLAHRDVLDQVLGKTTPIPFRFGTVLEEATLGAFVDRRREAILEAFGRIRGSVEMSVKAFLDSAPQSPEAVTPAERGGTPGPGARFLEAKRRQAVAGDAIESAARELGRRFECILDGMLLESSVETRSGERFARIRHRIQRADVEAYRGRIAEGLGSPNDPKGFPRCLLSGPWPPYTLLDTPAPATIDSERTIPGEAKRRDG